MTIDPKYLTAPSPDAVYIHTESLATDAVAQSVFNGDMSMYGRNVALDISGSCTIDEAVAKHLGWMKGAIRNQLVIYCHNDYDEELFGISQEQLPNMPSHNGFNLTEQLTFMRSKLCSDLEKEYVECEKNGFVDMTHFDKLDENLKEFDELIEKAARYKSLIVDELSKNDSSALRIDKLKPSSESNEIYITLASLDAWDRESEKNVSNTDNKIPAPAKPPRIKKCLNRWMPLKLQ